MKQQHAAVLLRALLVLAAVAAASGAAGRLLAPPLLEAIRRAGTHGVDGVPFDLALSAMCAAALAACWAWGVLVCVVTLLDAVRAAPSYRLRERRGCPRWLRGGVLALCGVAAVAVAAAPAQADLTGLPLPDRSLGAGPQVVTVRPGDSLWSITRRLLPADADDAAVAAAWPRLHRLNRDRVGPDPDLILPGTRLRLPDRLTSHPSGKDRP